MTSWGSVRLLLPRPLQASGRFSEVKSQEVWLVVPVSSLTAHWRFKSTLVHHVLPTWGHVSGVSCGAYLVAFDRVSGGGRPHSLRVVSK